MIKRTKGVRAAWASGLLMVKILTKCTLSSLVSDLFFDRQTWHSARRPNPATLIIHVYKGVERKKCTWTISCVNCATVSLLKTLALSLEENFKLMTNLFRCLHNLLPAMPKAVQRDADDTLTIYIPNRVKMVVLYGKTVVKFILKSYSCKKVFLDIFCIHWLSAVHQLGYSVVHCICKLFCTCVRYSGST